MLDLSTGVDPEPNEENQYPARHTTPRATPAMTSGCASLTERPNGVTAGKPSSRSRVTENDDPTRVRRSQNQSNGGEPSKASSRSVNLFTGLGRVRDLGFAPTTEFRRSWLSTVQKPRVYPCRHGLARLTAAFLRGSA